MRNSEKIFKTLSTLIENSILTSKDIQKEISTDLKFKKDKIISKLDLVSREEFEVLKKLVQKQDLIIKKFQKNKKSTHTHPQNKYPFRGRTHKVCAAKFRVDLYRGKTAIWRSV